MASDTTGVASTWAWTSTRPPTTATVSLARKKDRALARSEMDAEHLAFEGLEALERT